MATQRNATQLVVGSPRNVIRWLASQPASYMGCMTWLNVGIYEFRKAPREREGGK